MKFVIHMAALAIALAAHAALAQSWPAKPIRLISPYAAGGTNDVTARIVGERLAARLGQTVLVENKPGANNRIATEFVARSAPDGYTLLWVAAPHTVNPALYGRLPYDTVGDFASVAHTVMLPILFSVPVASPARTVKEFLALAKSDPLSATVCSPGNGSGPHLAVELLAATSGIPLAHVPYRGDAPAVNDLLGGRVGAGMNAFGTPLPHVKAGKLRALAVVATRRMPQLPEVPTFAEAGYAAVDAFAWFGLLAPAATPKEIVERLNAEVNQILRLPETIERFDVLGALPLGGSAQDFDKFIRADMEKWGRVVKERNIKAD
ncbi:MAG: tripartite tricarboxylate transporter substrate binding protein [Betaproteobacteria bacterium]|nr:tripartite tricarboxylate transporter substrate binding protein [Betaproteobacteria bacterium]